MSRIAIVDGIRTPFIKAWGLFGDLTAQELGRIAVSELLQISGLEPNLIDEVIIGSVAGSPEAANIARVISLYSGIPKSKRAYTVSRNCASGFESITSAAEKIWAGLDEIVVAGGAESMSNIPLIYNSKATKILFQLSKARSILERLGLFLKLNPSLLLNPVAGVKLGLTDPVCGLNMGETAEVLAKEFAITRKEQDEFALMSHKRASVAKEKLLEEIVPVIVPPKYGQTVEHDDGPRENQTIEDLSKLKPIFDRHTGTITVGNSCQISDGACALLVMKEEKAKELNFKPLGYIRTYTYVGLEPSHMGLGPAYAIPLVLKKAGLNLGDIQLIEINEAFAGQVIACEKALASKEFASKNFGFSQAIGLMDRSILNVNGGAIALGHPVGVTGSRLVLTILKEMQRRNLNLGLVSLCVGGGQGAAIVLER